MVDHRVVAAILRRGDQVLLCHRSPRRAWFPDVWDFPGGHVRPGELPQDALRRELTEELGIELEGVDGGPVLHLVDGEASVDLTVWVARAWRGTVANLQPDEHDAVAWFAPGQLEGLDLAHPCYLSLLQDVVRG